MFFVSSLPKENSESRLKLTINVHFFEGRLKEKFQRLNLWDVSDTFTVFIDERKKILHQ